MTAAQRIRDSIAALPEEVRQPWEADETTGWIVTGELGARLIGVTSPEREDSVTAHIAMLASPHVGEALANLLEAIRRCLNSDPQPCDHEETDDCLTDIAERTDALDAAIKREQT